MCEGCCHNKNGKCTREVCWMAEEYCWPSDEEFVKPKE